MNVEDAKVAAEADGVTRVHTWLNQTQLSDLWPEPQTMTTEFVGAAS